MLLNIDSYNLEGNYRGTLGYRQTFRSHCLCKASRRPLPRKLHRRMHLLRTSSLWQCFGGGVICRGSFYLLDSSLSSFIRPSIIVSTEEHACHHPRAQIMTQNLHAQFVEGPKPISEFGFPALVHGGCRLRGLKLCLVFNPHPEQGQCPQTP